MSDHKPLRAFASGVAALIAAAAAAYLLWEQKHPDGHTGWQLWCILIISAIGILSAVARIVRIFTIDGYEARERRVNLALRALAWSVHDITASPQDQTDRNDPDLVRALGCSAWIVTGQVRPKRMCRIGRERVNVIPVPSKIDWSRGKGIIGKCWESGQQQVVDTGGFDQNYGNHTAQQWAELNDDTRRGLTYDEYGRIRGKYGTVIAVPLLRQEKVIGVVALDGPPGSYPRLSTDVAINTVAATSVMIMEFLS